MCGENGLNSTSVNCFKFREHVGTAGPYLCTSISICTLCGTFGTKSLFKTIARLARTYALMQSISFTEHAIHNSI